MPETYLEAIDDSILQKKTECAWSIRDILFNGRITAEEASRVTGVAARSLLTIAQGDTHGFSLFEIEQILEKISGGAQW